MKPATSAIWLIYLIIAYNEVSTPVGARQAVGLVALDRTRSASVCPAIAQRLVCSLQEGHVYVNAVPCVSSAPGGVSDSIIYAGQCPHCMTWLTEAGTAVGTQPPIATRRPTVLATAAGSVVDDYHW